MKNYITRDNCRLCFSKEVEKIYSFPLCPPVDDFRLETELSNDIELFPMDLYLCKSCGHVQLLDVVDPKILFGNYIYTSSSSPDLDVHFDEYSKKLRNLLSLNENNFVIDIGSNDGLFLSKFKNYGIKVLGIDASSNAAKIAIENGIKTVVSFVNSEVVNKILKEYGSADVVTANNVFSHSDDLTGFLLNARDLLKKDGYFIFEVSYLKAIIDNKVIDYVYHEHLAHHSIKPLKAFLEKNKMRLVNVDFVDTKGGSIRCYAVNEASEINNDLLIDELIKKEEAAGLYNPKTYEKLKSEITIQALELNKYLEQIKKDGGKIFSYGASATATVLNYLFDINKYFTFVIDDNHKRQNRFSPGVQIPVVSKDVINKDNPKAIVISSWRFANMIIQNNVEYLNNGGQFIIPLPEFKIIKN